MTIVNVALPTFVKDFDASTTTVEWVVTGYLLSLAVFIPVSGWAGDRFGTKRTFMFALSVFTLALTALQPGLEHRGVDRLPRAPGRRRRHADPRRHGHALSGLPPGRTSAGRGPAGHPHGGGAGQRAGPGRLPGGVPVLALDLPGSTSPSASPACWWPVSSCARRSRPNPGRLDVPGFLLAAAGLATLLYALAEAGSRGFDDTRVLACRPSRTRPPRRLLPRRAADGRAADRRPPAPRQLFRAANTVQFAGFAGYAGALFLLPLSAAGGDGIQPPGVGPHHLPPGHRRGHDGAARRSPLHARGAASAGHDRHGRRRAHHAGLPPGRPGHEPVVDPAHHAAARLVVRLHPGADAGRGLRNDPFRGHRPCERHIQRRPQVAASFGVALLGTVLTNRLTHHGAVLGNPHAATEPSWPSTTPSSRRQFSPCWRFLALLLDDKEAARAVQERVAVAAD